MSRWKITSCLASSKEVFSEWPQFEWKVNWFGSRSQLNSPTLQCTNPVVLYHFTIQYAWPSEPWQGLYNLPFFVSSPLRNLCCYWCDCECAFPERVITVFHFSLSVSVTPVLLTALPACCAFTLKSPPETDGHSEEYGEERHCWEILFSSPTISQNITPLSERARIEIHRSIALLLLSSSNPPAQM